MFNIQPLFSKSQTNEAECNGIKYYRYFPIRISNKMTIRISFVEINSTFEQAILFLFPCDFSGNIQINGKTATVIGVERLYGATVAAHDLRAGAALLIAGLVAEGITTVDNIHFIERGYENLVEKFTELGATIRRIDD